MRLILMLVLFFASSAFAQELSSDYVPIGKMEMTVDGQAQVFHIATIPKSNRSFAEIKVFFGQKMLTITGVSVDKDGGYTRPMISLTISLAKFGPKGLSSVEYMEEGRDSKHPTAANMETGELEMSNFTITENGEIELDFSAEAIRLVSDANWELSPEEGMPPVVMSGHVSVTIPDEFRQEE